MVVLDRIALVRPISSCLLVVLALSLVGCDQTTKHFAVAQLQDAPQSFLGGLFELTYAENHDMAFGLLETFLAADSRLLLLTAVKFSAVLFGVTYFFMRSRAASNLERAAVVLLVSGAMGNLIDRLARGFVVDFLKVPHWPVFNVADIVIVVGGALFALEAWRNGRGSPSDAYLQPVPVKTAEQSRHRR